MNILLLSVLSGLLSAFAYKTSALKLLSPTFLSSGMFCGFSIIYILSFNFIGQDIKTKTVIYILSSLFLTYVGELIANRFTEKKSLLNNSSSISIATTEYRRFYMPSFKVTCIITAVMLIVAIIRFVNLRYFASQYGSFNDFMSMMSTARIAVNQGEDFNLSSGIIAQIVYLSTGVCFFYTYIFLEQIILLKSKKYYLLLPIIFDCLIEFSTTGRTSIIMIVIGFIVSYFHILVTHNKGYKLRLSKKLYIYIFLFLVVFFIYGGLRKGNNASEVIDEIVGSIVSYSCAGIYGLDYYLEHPWSPNSYFAAYTGRNIYSLLGIEHNYIPDANLPFYLFGDGGGSNIYTSLVLPIQDYGIGGLFITRVILAIISTWILNVYLRKDTSKRSIYIYNLLAIFIVNGYINTPIADRFYTFFLNPMLLIRYVVYLLGFVWLMTRVRIYLKK